jgi:hypothetical protein
VSCVVEKLACQGRLHCAIEEIIRDAVEHRGVAGPQDPIFERHGPIFAWDADLAV